jgi:hypothetical protein
MVNLAPTSAAARRGRRLAVTLSVLCLAAAALLWLGAGYRAANECREGAYHIPSADAVRFSEGGCEVAVDGGWSDPLPSRDETLALAALIFAALAAVPPYLLVFRRRD